MDGGMAIVEAGRAKARPRPLTPARVTSGNTLYHARFVDARWRGQREDAVSESEFSQENRVSQRVSTATRAFFPGDRGNRRTQPDAQRPSLWRRLALGRRGSPPEPAPEPAPAGSFDSPTPAPGAQPPERSAQPFFAAAPSPTADPFPRPAPIDAQLLERRIMEPMLQALVSVESKLERSHSELVDRSDKVERRLAHLWEIEEQLSTLDDVQEKLLRVSEQQRRLESAIVGQTRTLRWLIGAVFFSLAAAAFVVAAIL
jgi:hypothetical protein